VLAVATPSVDSEIRFEVWLPIDNWNSRFQAVGNGGWAGALTYGTGTPQAIPRNMAFALNEGYATASTDTGHVSGGRQGEFAVGHPEKLIDFAYRAVHEMTVNAKAIIQAFYGQPATFSYWNGCSTGGRQGLMEAQRFPEDFDGIIAGAPASDWTHLMAAIITSAQAAHEGQPGNLTGPKLRLLHEAVLRACDALDGVRDGVLHDPSRCTFDPGTLLCQGGVTSECLTAAEIEGASRLYAGAVDPTTKRVVFPGMARGSELGWDPNGGLQPFPIAESHFRHVVLNDQTWDYRTFSLEREGAKSDTMVADLMNATDPNLQRFFGRGGKLLQYHGWTDQQISPFSSVSYYHSVVQQVGEMAVQGSYRLFMMPGMNHCGGGAGPNQFDPMSAMVRWRESNVAPERLMVTHVTNGVVDTTRPVCAYPHTAEYEGVGSSRDAASFSCKDP